MPLFHWPPHDHNQSYSIKKGYEEGEFFRKEVGFPLIKINIFHISNAKRTVKRWKILIFIWGIPTYPKTKAPRPPSPFFNGIALNNTHSYFHELHLILDLDIIRPGDLWISPSHIKVILSDNNTGQMLSCKNIRSLKKYLSGCLHFQLKQKHQLIPAPMKTTRYYYSPMTILRRILPVIIYRSSISDIGYYSIGT